MYSYLNAGRGYHPDRINLEIHLNVITNTVGPISSAVKFKLAAFTVPANA